MAATSSDAGSAASGGPSYPPTQPCRAAAPPRQRRLPSSPPDHQCPAGLLQVVTHSIGALTVPTFKLADGRAGANDGRATWMFVAQAEALIFGNATTTGAFRKLAAGAGLKTALWKLTRSAVNADELSDAAFAAVLALYRRDVQSPLANPPKQVRRAPRRPGTTARAHPPPPFTAGKFRCRL